MSVTRLVIAILLGVCPAALAEDWPQWLGPNRDSLWRESGIVAKFPEGGPKVRWRAPINGGYSGPAVAGGLVYVTDRTLAQGTDNPKDPFQRGSIPGSERVVCLNDADGSVKWVYEYPCAYTMSYAAGPRGTPLISGGRVYAAGGEGDVCCLDATSGQKLWHVKLGTAGATPMWGFAGSPLLEGDKLICVGDGKDAVLVALNKDTGAVIWKALKAKEPGYSSPMLVEAGGKRQLVMWYPEAVASLDPQTGQKYWSEPFTSNMGLSVATPRRDGDLLFITSFYNGAMMLRLDSNKPGATQLWQRKGKNEQHTDTIQAILCTPFMRDGYVYGVGAYGELRCIRAENGQKVWDTYAATSGEAGPVRWSNAFLVANGNRFFLANEHGDLLLAELTPAGYKEISRAHLIEPTNMDANRPVVWAHPAFANRCVYLRNDKEIVCASLADDQK